MRGCNVLKLILIITSFAMVACTKVKIHEYENTTPALSLQEFFNGDLKVFGMLQDRSGKVTRRFSADIEARWQNGIGTLDETFYFDDGEVSKRIWKLQDQGNGHYSGTAGDVIGQATGQISGFAFNWKYTLRIPYKSDTIDVKLDDWLYLIDANHLLNRTRLTKFGFEVGQLTLVIEKL